MHEVIVFAGYPKTASQWLLNSVWNAKDSGFATLEKPRAIAGQFIHNNPLTFDADALQALYAPRMRAVLDAGDVPVVHHEGLVADLFSARPPGLHALQQVRAVFPRARVVLVVREQKNLILSWYRHNVRLGLGVSLRSYLTEIDEGITPFFRYDLFDFNCLVEQVRHLVGGKNLLVLAFEGLLADPRRYVEQICRFCEISMPPTEPPASRRNVGIGAQETIMLGFVNRLFSNDYPRPRKSGNARRAAVSSIRLFAALAPQSMERRAANYLKRMVSDHVGNRFARSNRELQLQTGLDLAQYGYPV